MKYDGKKPTSILWENFRHALASGGRSGGGPDRCFPEAKRASSAPTSLSAGCRCCRCFLLLHPLESQLWMRLITSKRRDFRWEEEERKSILLFWALIVLSERCFAREEKIVAPLLLASDGDKQLLSQEAFCLTLPTPPLSREYLLLNPSRAQNQESVFSKNWFFAPRPKIFPCQKQRQIF